RVLMESGHGKLSRVAGAEPNGRVRRRLSNPEVRGMDDLLTEREGHAEHRDRLTRGEFELLGLSLRRHLCLHGAIEKEDADPDRLVVLSHAGELYTRDRAI